MVSRSKISRVKPPKAIWIFLLLAAGLVCRQTVSTSATVCSYIHVENDGAICSGINASTFGYDSYFIAVNDVPRIVVPAR